MKSAKLMRQIREKFAYFQTYVINENRNNRRDVNTEAEAFYKPILDIVFDTDFKVLEYEQKNTPGIDLGCKKNKIAIQITSETSSKKVESSIIKFMKFHNATYNKLYIFFIGREIKFRITNEKLKNIITQEQVKQNLTIESINEIITKDQLWDIPLLEKEIEKKFQYEIETLEKINRYLEEQMSHLRSNSEDDLEILSELSSLNEKLRQKESIIEALLFLFDKFENLLVIPPNILSKLYPFSKTVNSKSYYYQFSLYTDNEELFDFFSKVSKNNLSEIPGFDLTDEFIEKIKTIINVLKFNLINHLYLIDNRAKICIHELVNSKGCDCERCCYERFDFAEAINKVSGSINQLSNFEALRYTYVHYQLGNFKKAFELYTSLRKRFYDEKKPISYFICQYNLVNLLRFLRAYYWQDDRDAVLTKIRDINLDIELIKLQKEGLEKEQVQFLKWIKEERFLDRSIQTVVKTVREIEEHYQNDQLGGFSKHDKVNELLLGFAQMSVFIDMNFIIYNNFSEYSEVVHLVFNGFVAAASIQNEESSKLMEFNDYIIDLPLCHGEAKVINNIFNKYHLKYFNYDFPSEGHQSSFFDRINNFHLSIEAITVLIQDSPEGPNYFFRDKFNAYFKNILVLLSRIEIQASELNKHIKNLLHTAQKIDFLYPQSFEFFSILFDHKGSKISQENFESAILIYLKIEKYRNFLAISSLIQIFNHENPKYILSNKTIIELLIKPFIKNSKKQHIGHLYLLDFWDIASPKLKDSIKKIIEEHLREAFDADLYYEAVLKEIIDYMPLFDEFIKTIPIYSDMISIKEAFTGKRDHRNYRLDQLIKLSYKYNIDLQTESMQFLCGNITYYEWLMNIETFDYSKFKVYWILECVDSDYYKILKKIPQIHQAIKKAMVERYLEGLAHVYFRYFIE